MTDAHSARVARINSLLERHPTLDGEARDRLLRERRSLLRIIHNIPLLVQLPLDWQP